MRGLERHDAGIGAHDVEVTELRDPFANGRGELLTETHVGLQCQDSLPRRFHLGDRVGHVLVGSQWVLDRIDLLKQIDGNHLSALFRYADSVALALSPRRPCDERNLALQAIPHGEPPSSDGTAPDGARDGPRQIIWPVPMSLFCTDVLDWSSLGLNPRSQGETPLHDHWKACA